MSTSASADIELAELMYQALQGFPDVYLSAIDRSDRQSTIDDLSSVVVDGSGIDLVEIARVARAHVIQSRSTSATSRS